MGKKESFSFILMFQEMVNYIDSNINLTGTKTLTESRESADQDRTAAYFGTLTSTATREEKDSDKANTSQFNAFPDFQLK